MTPRAALITLTVVAALATGCGDDKPTASSPSSTPAPTTFQVHGTVILTLSQFDGEPDNPAAGCSGRGGYDDILGGAPVTVTDAAGATIGLGTLRQGKLITDEEACSLSFSVVNIPAGKSFYGIEVSRRGRVQYPEAELRTAVKLTIG